MVYEARRKGGPTQHPRDKFHFLLDKLSETGYVKLISRGDKLYWMRLRSPLELEEGAELTPEKASQMIDEARAKREAEEHRSEVRKEKEEQEIQKPTIGEMADVILSQLLKEHGTEKLRAYVARGESEDIRRPIK
jgi:tRNA A37 threonylcarbamoyladenosine modification protein TsaB